MTFMHNKDMPSWYLSFKQISLIEACFIKYDAFMGLKDTSLNTLFYEDSSELPKLIPNLADQFYIGFWLRCQFSAAIKKYKATMMSHVGVGDSYTCAACKLQFSSRIELESHETLLHPNFQCHICNVTFKHKSTYSTHNKKHINNLEKIEINLHSCKQCGEKFDKYNALIVTT